VSDWEVGDKALCVESGHSTRQGVIYTVSDVWPSGDEFQGVVNITQDDLLLFVELGFLGDGSNCQRFRKIRPDKHEPCEEEFTTLLKRKPVSV
jgi:hypothetical protein